MNTKNKSNFNRPMLTKVNTFLEADYNFRKVNLRIERLDRLNGRSKDRLKKELALARYLS